MTDTKESFGVNFGALGSEKEVKHQQHTGAFCVVG